MEEPNMTSTSNITQIEKYIEDNIEKKINQFLSVINFDKNNSINSIYPSNEKKHYSSYTLHELYKTTIQSTIDIINDVVELLSDRNYISYNVFRQRLFNIFLKDDRKFFIGIILIILSFIIYFIDGSSI